jgi:hypothetical protein
LVVEPFCLTLHCGHWSTLAAQFMWYSTLQLLHSFSDPGFLHTTHREVCTLSIVSEAGNPGICSESDPDVDDVEVCGEAFLCWAPVLLSCEDDEGGFSSRRASVLKLRVSWRVGGGNPDER